MPNARALPNLRRRQLGDQLRKYRNQAKKSLDTVAAEMGGTWDASRLSRVENAKRTIRPDDVLRLLDLYSVASPEARDPLETLARDASKPGHWWSLYGNAIPSSYEDYLWLESDALELRTNAPKIIPGLLQTPDYARNIIASTAIGATPQEVAARAQIRKTRQAVLTHRDDRPPLRLWAIIHESALRVRAATIPTLMRDQVRHLEEMSHLANVTIQVLPDGAEANPGMVNAFGVVRFQKPWPTAINIEHLGGGSILEGENDVTMYEQAFDHTVAAALPATESRARLQQMIKDGRP